MAFKLMTLPYAQNALEPAISKETINFHYGKHHKGYVDNLNKLIKDTAYEDMKLKEIIREAAGQGRGGPWHYEPSPLFNNAAQVYNHNLYWKSLRPEQPISEKAEERINRYYGSVDGLKTTITQIATKHFGSGWVWICEREDKGLFVRTTPDAGTPIVDGLVTPLLVIDLWEHAYYLQYKNDRAAYIDAVWPLLNWDKLVDNQLVSEMTINVGTLSDIEVKRAFDFLIKNGKHVGDQDNFKVLRADHEKTTVYGIVSDEQVVTILTGEATSNIFILKLISTLPEYRKLNHARRLLWFIKDQEGKKILDYGAQTADGIQFVKSLSAANRFDMYWYNTDTKEKVKYNPNIDGPENEPFRGSRMTPWKILIEGNRPSFERYAKDQPGGEFGAPYYKIWE